MEIHLVADGWPRPFPICRGIERFDFAAAKTRRYVLNEIEQLRDFIVLFDRNEWEFTLRELESQEWPDSGDDPSRGGVTSPDEPS